VPENFLRCNYKVKEQKQVDAPFVRDPWLDQSPGKRYLPGLGYSDLRVLPSFIPHSNPTLNLGMQIFWRDGRNQVIQGVPLSDSGFDD